MANLTLFEGLLSGIDVLVRSTELLNYGQYQTFQGSGSSSIVQSAIAGLGSSNIEYSYGSGTPESLTSLFNNVNEATRIFISNGLPIYWYKTSIKELAASNNAMTYFLLGAMGSPMSYISTSSSSYSMSKMASNTDYTSKMGVMLEQLSRRKIPNTRSIGASPIALNECIVADMFYSANPNQQVRVIGNNTLRFLITGVLDAGPVPVPVPISIRGLNISEPKVTVINAGVASTRLTTWDLCTGGVQVSIYTDMASFKITELHEMHVVGVPEGTQIIIDLCGKWTSTSCSAINIDNLPHLTTIIPSTLEPIARLLLQCRENYISMVMPRILASWQDFIAEIARRYNNGEAVAFINLGPGAFLNVNYMVNMIKTAGFAVNNQMARDTLLEWLIGSYMLIILSCFNISYN